MCCVFSHFNIRGNHPKVVLSELQLRISNDGIPLQEGHGGSCLKNHLISSLPSLLRISRKSLQQARTTVQIQWSLGLLGQHFSAAALFTFCAGSLLVGARGALPRSWGDV